MFELKILSILCFTGQLRQEDFLEGHYSQQYNNNNLIIKYCFNSPLNLSGTRPQAFVE